jgi:hypothetical protein
LPGSVEGRQRHLDLTVVGFPSRQLLRQQEREDQDFDGRIVPVPAGKPNELIGEHGDDGDQHDPREK